MTALTEGHHTGLFLMTELPGTLSRDTVTVDVPAATTLISGQVLGKLSATGHYVPYDETYSDGREAASAILYTEALDNSAGGSPAAMTAVVIDFAAEVRTDDLVWGTADDAAGLIDLRAVGIKAR